MARDPIKGHLDLLLLRILQDGPAHGYEVITALRERSDGTFDLPEGTVYPALHRLEEAGLLASTWDASGTRRRRVYSLTAAGATALTTEHAAWRRLVNGVGAILASPGTAQA
jgi:PadR family transcriptional regulator, regulatory protein PadR